MNKKSSLLPILLGLITVFFVSCDRDFNELGSSIVGDNHFGFIRDTVKTIKSYNQKLGPIASNNLPINPLGFYENPAFGDTQANFVTQVELAALSPVFNNTDPTLYNVLPVVDSVIVDIPYFVDKTQTSAPDTNNKRTYVLDSIYGVNESKFKLSVYRSNYYLRDLDPGSNLADTQSYFTDQNADIDNNKIPELLNDSPNVTENSEFYFDKREHALKSKNSNGEDVVTRTVPSMRLHLNKEVFDKLILNAPSGQLASNSAFKNYFRGLYFKTESIGNPGNMAMINFKAGKITMYYQEDKKTGTGNAVTRVNKTFVLNLNGNTISLLNNSNEKMDYLNATNEPSLDASRLYLKGGEGALTVIDLFGSTDLYGYKKRTDDNGKPIDEDGVIIKLDKNGDPESGYFVYERTSSSNGVVDELDDLRYPRLNETEFYSKEKKLLVNDASLLFYIDRGAMSDIKTAEPQRIYLYDLTNNRVLTDYAVDGTTNNVDTKNNKFIFGGILEIKDMNDGYGKRGTQYRIRITNHIRNMLNDIDVANVRLGLSVTESIANVAFSKVKAPNSNFNVAPTMSVMNPLGTVLYGSNIPVGDKNYGKRLKLEIDYTKPN